MRITFELENEQEVRIMNGDKQIGRVFTPSGTSRDVPNAIQVCGAIEIFEYWGCGVFSNKDGNPAKDIQILFEGGTKPHSSLKNFNLSTGCGRCFFPKDKCMCWDLKLIEKEDIPKAKKKREIYLTKHKILEGLEDKNDKIYNW